MESQPIIDVVERLASHEKIADNVVAIPAGKKIEDIQAILDRRLAQPRARTGRSEHTTLESFVAHAKRFGAVETSAIFADDSPSSPGLTTVYDYHDVGASGQPRHGRHRSHYGFPLSEEWRAWEAVDDKAMTQAQFAEFLETRVVDVLEPSAAGDSTRRLVETLGIALAGPSTLLALSRGLSVRVDAKVVQAVNLSTGETQISYEETHQSKEGGALKVPGGFAIAIPVFRGGARYQVAVRLRYRVTGAQVSWRVALHRAEASFAHAFGEACATAKSETGLPLFSGTPESAT